MNNSLEDINKDLASAGLSPIKIEAGEKQYVMSGGKTPYPLLVLENICQVIETDTKLASLFRLNDFSHMVEYRHNGQWTNLVDNVIYDTQRYISREYLFFAKISTDMTTIAIRSCAAKNKVNPPKDYFASLVWDKTPRLDTWLVSAYGTPDEPVYHAIGSNWLKGLVKRVVSPGCIFDEVLVLESPQGWRKSTSLRELARPWHVECTVDVNNKDFYMLLAQNVVVEFSEGDVVNRTEARKIKAIVTKTEDQYRPPYERGLQTFPRGCVFAMTTNDKDYQKDDTGGRRWLPVELGKEADINWIRENRDQLFAEAYHRAITLKESTHEYPKEEIEQMQRDRMEHDDSEESIVEWYARLSEERKNEGIRVIDAYHGAISKDPTREMSKLMQMQLAGMFRRALFLEKRKVMKDENRSMRWFSTDKTVEICKNVSRETF